MKLQQRFKLITRNTFRKFVQKIPNDRRSFNIIASLTTSAILIFFFLHVFLHVTKKILLPSSINPKCDSYLLNLHNHFSPSNLSLNVQPIPQLVLTYPFDNNEIKKLKKTVDAGICYRFNNKRNKKVIKCLPSFIIVGMMKSGTGELMKWLNLHPYLKSAATINGQNELHYFSDSHSIENNKTQENWFEYLNLFPVRNNKVRTFEKSPDYIRSKKSMLNLKNMLPSIKIIILIRDPLKRAISEFQHHCRHGRYIKPLKVIKTQKFMYYKNTIYFKNEKNFLESTNRLINPLFDLNLKLEKDIDYKVLKYPCSILDFQDYIMNENRFLQNTSFGLNSSEYELIEGKGNLRVSFEKELDDFSVSGKCLKESKNKTFFSNDENMLFAPEIKHSFYDFQLKENLFDIFPSDQILVLLQEDMYRDTLKTLHLVQSFLQLPCFNFKSAAVSFEKIGEPPVEDNQNPPRRFPKSMKEKWNAAKYVLRNYFKINPARDSTDKLLRQMSDSTRNCLEGIFKMHNKEIVEFLKNKKLDDRIPLNRFKKINK